jgi:hypothetical protein
MSSLRFFSSSSSAAVAALLALLAAVPACTAAATDNASESEDAYRVTPVDGETLALLKVRTPTGWTLPVNPADDATVTYRNASIPLNVQQRLTDGDGNLVVSSKFDVAVNAGNIALAKGTSTSYGLASLKPTYKPASDAASTLARDFGPLPTLKVFYTGASVGEAQVYGQSRSNAAFWSGDPQRALLAPPGAYRFSWSLPILSDITKTLGEGKNVTVSLDPSDQRATIVVKKPTARDLPDAPVPQCHMATRTFLVHRRVDNANGQYGEPASYDQRNTQQPAAAIQNGYVNYSNAYDQATSWAALPMKDDTTVKVFPFAASEGANHYELVVNNVAMPLALKPGDTKTIQLERLDVDDVEITKETGETYMAHGSYQLFRQGPNASWIPITVRQDCSNGAGQQVAFPTNAGIDVLPGTYRLLISYATAEGAKQQEQVVTVP